MAPTKGIAPGCPAATTRVKLCYMDAIERWQKENQTRAGKNRITVNVYIDDFIVTIRGDNEDAMVHIGNSSMWDKTRALSGTINVGQHKGVTTTSTNGARLQTAPA